MIIPREVNAIKRLEAAKEQGDTTANGVLIQDSPDLGRAVVADGAVGVAHSGSKSLPQNRYSGERIRMAARQFVTAPREADETSSAYLAITPDV
jgi:hypothetical protein